MGKSAKTTNVKFVTNYDEYKKGKEYEVLSTMVPFLKGVGLIEINNDTTTASGEAIPVPDTKLRKRKNANRLEKKTVGGKPREEK